MKYDYQTLTNFCEEHNIVLCEDYSLKTKINAFTIIEGNCINNCGNTFIKNIKDILNNNFSDIYRKNQINNYLPSTILINIKNNLVK